MTNASVRTVLFARFEYTSVVTRLKSLHWLQKKSQLQRLPRCSVISVQATCLLHETHIGTEAFGAWGAPFDAYNKPKALMAICKGEIIFFAVSTEKGTPWD